MQYWSDILGHQRVQSVLSRAIDGGRLHHAYLFTGPEGVGKFTTAQTLAATLNCERRPADTFAPSCGQCSSCRRIASRQHPDVLFIEPTGKSVRLIKIDQIRQLQKSAASSPYEGRFRVVLIDDAHLLREEAANALLKTLEEPPARTILLLVTDQPHRLLDTIISRCQRVRFGSLSLETVADALPKLLTQADPEAGDFDADSIDPTLFPVAAGYGEGSLGRSLAMLKSGMLAERQEFLEQMLGLDPRSPIAWLNAAKDLADSGSGFQEKLDVLTVFFRDMMLFKRTGTDRLVNQDLHELIARIEPRFSMEALLTTLDALMSARRRLRGNVNSQLLAEELLDRLRNPQTRALTPPA